MILIVISLSVYRGTNRSHVFNQLIIEDITFSLILLDIVQCKYIINKLVSIWQS